MSEFNAFIEKYEEALIPQVYNDGTAESILSLSQKELRDLSSDDAYIYGYSLNSYAMYLQGELDKARARLAWCEEAVNSIVGKNYTRYNTDDTRYMPQDSKRQLIISDNSAARELEKFRLKIQAVVTLLFNKIKIILTQGELLVNLGKKKSYAG